MASNSNTMYLGDLPVDTTEMRLTEFLGEVGPNFIGLKLLSRDPSRLRYAYVNYQTSDEVNKAIEKIEQKSFMFGNRYIRASKFQPPGERKQKSNLFVKGLPEDTLPNELKDIFQDYGTVFSTKVAYDNDNKCRGYGFVDFENEENAKKVADLKTLNFKNANVTVEYFRPRNDRVDNFTNLYLKEFPESFSIEDLIAIFKNYGTVTSSCMKTDNRGRKYAFLNFDSHENAVKAIEEMNGKEIEGKSIYVSRQLSKVKRMEEVNRIFEKRKAEDKEKYKQTNLFIKNLPDSIKSTDDLKEMFERFGTIRSALYVGDKKRHGFVAYSSTEESLKAMKEVNGMVINEQKPIVVQLALTREERGLLYNQTKPRFAEQYMMFPGYPPMPMRFSKMSPAPYFQYQMPMHIARGQMKQSSNYGRGMQTQLRKNDMAPMQQQQPYQRKQYPKSNPQMMQYPRQEQMMQQQPQPQMMQPAPQVPQPQPQLADNKKYEDEMKQEYGESIYNYLSQTEKYSELAPKLTGILISSLPLTELKQCVDDEVLLSNRVEEAYKLLQSNPKK